MRRAMVFVTVLSLALVFWLGATSGAQASTFRYYRPYYRPVTPVMNHTGHMPGWDWWKIYPYSPYNYGRNPYNPAILPYPSYYVNPYPVYVPEPAYVPPTPVQLTLPTASGPLATPPPGTALIQVQVPDRWATVTFNGQDSYTNGTQRYFVTPRLSGATTRYKIAASWYSNGQLVKQEQGLSVYPGETTVVSFGR